MPDKLTDMTPACNTQAETEMGIVLGVHRVRRATWEDAAGMCLNGAGFVRDGADLRHFTSDAYENGLWMHRRTGKYGH